MKVVKTKIGRRSFIKSSLISINSPIARSLIGKEEGDTVFADTPSGQKEFEILKILYE